MAHIRIDYDGLNQQVSRLNNHIQQYQTLGSKVNTLVAQMQASWTGESCNAYVEKMQEYMVQADKMIGVLEAFRNYADSATKDFSTVDQQCASMIRSSF